MCKPILILGGGTFSPVRNHLAIAAPAFGTTARWLHEKLPNADLLLTKMADHRSSLVTNEQVKEAIQPYLNKEALRCIVMNVALCDYDGQIGDVVSGKHAQRLQSREGNQWMELSPSDKVIASLKENRKDLILVGFKTTTNFSKKEQIYAANRMGTGAACDLILANDTVNRRNLLIANQECLAESSDREEILNILVNELNHRIA